MKPSFEMSFTAAPEDIDELGHVNNAVWVRWLQDVAVAHWYAAADPKHHAAYMWVVSRHEIDYRRPLKEGETVVARTWVADRPTGARFDRHAEFTRNGVVHLQSKTSWAMIERASGRLKRIPDEVVAPFLG
jgi:acyl-CoA thioester hydrolase